MAQKNLTSGLDHTNTSATGKITWNMDSAYSTTQMAISTKEDGPKIKDTDRAHTGSQIPKTNSEGSILATGKMTLNKAEVPCSTNWETDTMECGWTIYLTAKAEWSIPTEMFMKVCGIWEREAATEFLLKDVEIISKGTGWMTRGKAKDLIFFQRRTKFL